MPSGSGGACSAVGRAQTDSPVASSAAEHGVGDSSSGAILPPQRECGDETDEDSEGSEEESEDEIDTNSDGACSDDGCHSKSGRGHLEASNSNGPAGSADTSETAPGLRSLEPADGFSEPTTCLTAAAVQERAAAMFVVGTSAPQASGMSPAAKRATMELVMLAYNAANELCDTQGDALSKSFANFDRVVALGWLLGDAMGARLLLREQAYAVGLKARKAAVALKVDVVAKKKAVQRRYAGLLWSTSGPKGPRRRKRRGSRLTLGGGQVMPHARRLLSVLWVARLAISRRAPLPRRRARKKKGYVSYHISGPGGI